MSKLILQMMASVDGYINDAGGDFDWGPVEGDVHEHANAEARRLDLDIYGRRMYETMLYWETYDGDDPIAQDFAKAWKANDKLVVSSSLKQVSSANTELVAALDVDAMRRLKAERKGPISVSGPTLAAQYLDAGLVDEIGVYTIPVVVGAGTPLFQVTKKLKMVRTEARAFDCNGITFARYDVLN